MALLGAAAAAGLFAGIVAVTGGIDTSVAGVPLRSRSWGRPAAAAALLAIAAAAALRAELVRAVSRTVRVARARSTGIAAVVMVPAACWAAVAGLRYGTFAVGGADSYGYVSQATLLLHGRLTATLAANPAFTWPDVPATLTPLGYTRGRSAELLSPVYPPGLPLLMTPLAALHDQAVFLLVPLCAGAAVFLCFALGRQFGDPLAASLAAVLLSVSPTFLYQAVQPMSDVPATACWLAALVSGWRAGMSNAVTSGALASVAILIRPNLAPLGVLVVAAAAAAEPRAGVRRATAAMAAMIPALAALGVVQYVRYGSPFSSGYGPARDLFSLSNVGPNWSRYTRWLTDTHTVFIWLCAVSPLWIRRLPPRPRRLAWLCCGFVAAVWLAYLPYVYFRPEEWFYTRFLLPALPLMLLLATGTLRWVLQKVVPRGADAAALVLLVLIVVAFATRASRAGAFELWRAEAKYPIAGRFIRAHVPASAYVLAMQHSGSIRYYAQRQTVRWDLLDPAWLDRAVAALHAAGHETYAVLDPDELVEFRKRFTPAGQRSIDRMLPVVTVGRTRIFQVK
jgi:hypothetical protein